MPVTNGIGHSLETKNKAYGFDRIISQLLSTVKKIIHKHNWACKSFQYIDTNAGSGFNPDEQCDGSPIIFLNAAHRAKLAYNAYFIEIERQHSEKLLARSWGNCRIITADNRQVLPQVLGTISKNSYGVLYHDPNGIPDFDLLAWTSRHDRMRYIDILIRYAASGVKRNQHITGKKMLDYLATIKKKYWIVREVEQGDKWQWTFLLGLNWNGLRSWEEQGFHYVNSKMGKMIIEKLNYTIPERKKLGQLELALYTTYPEYLRHPIYRNIRQQAIDRSGSICELCKKQPVTEVHHLEYPPWGTFEKDASKLLALCHQCHCKIHGKEQ